MHHLCYPQCIRLCTTSVIPSVSGYAPLVLSVRSMHFRLLLPVSLQSYNIMMTSIIFTDQHRVRPSIILAITSFPLIIIFPSHYTFAHHHVPSHPAKEPFFFPFLWTRQTFRCNIHMRHSSVCALQQLHCPPSLLAVDIARYMHSVTRPIIHNCTWALKSPFSCCRLIF